MRSIWLEGFEVFLYKILQIKPSLISFAPFNE